MENFDSKSLIAKSKSFLFKVSFRDILNCTAIKLVKE